MNEQNKNSKPHEETPKTVQGDSSSWKRVLSKRWVFPAAYLAAAAIILTLVWVYQDASQKALSTQGEEQVEQSVKNTANTAESTGEEAVEVTANAQSLIWPVADDVPVTIVKPYFDETDPDTHQAAMVQYNDTFSPNLGIDLATADDAAFEVRAALSGKVTRVENHPVNGNVVEITSGNTKTVYQSLNELKVEEGAEVKQGDAIATAGRSELEKDLGNHVHFEVYEDGNLVNPVTVLPQK
ncbi:stage II sporulation protein spoIIQ [Paenibacillus sp. JCM 10914]|uniref:M23 family metallopeptidase n=1 Tax=Paenibacillus sp. JCM 10914 TaxID=1236974 RepID=UPI0003CCAE8B|nr:M23 family metallopeptidase [Paenibacillus sp. JCM 10914]GAE09827.1 stage II sporulation protein [Paenibacillus sp. JCM 10914]